MRIIFLSDPFKTEISEKDPAANPVLGSSFTLTCAIKGTGNPTTVQKFRWTHNKTTVDIIQPGSFMASTTNDLTIDPVTFNNSGTYKCYADNSADGFVLETPDDEAQHFTLDVYCKCSVTNV